MNATSVRPLAVALAVLTLVPASALADPGDGGLRPLALDGPGRYQAGWQVVESTLTFDGHLDVSAERRVAVPVRAANVTDVTVIVRWQDTEEEARLTRPDRFEVTLVGADGVPVTDAPSTARSGVLRVASGAVNAVPDPVEVDATSLAHARALMTAHATNKGSGDWALWVRLLDAGNPTEAAPVDRGNAYTVEVTIRSYEAKLTRIVALAPPATSLAEAAEASPPVWLWTTGGLAAAAVALSVVLWRARSRDG